MIGFPLAGHTEADCTQISFFVCAGFRPSFQDAISAQEDGLRLKPGVGCTMAGI
jgi:hypothetical protein